MKKIDSQIPPTQPKVSKAALWLTGCCFLMVVLGLGMVFMLPSPSSGDTSSSWWMFALPILGCLAAHVVMHNYNGRSCHRRKEN